MLLRAALQSADLLPSDVAALQMHSNGTPLGDPIEVGAAAAVLLQVALMSHVKLWFVIYVTWLCTLSSCTLMPKLVKSNLAS